jgi:hypothetical protein
MVLIARVAVDYLALAGAPYVGELDLESTPMEEGHFDFFS